MRHSLRKQEILRGHGSFATIFKKGSSLKSGRLRCSVVVSPASTQSPLQIGFAVGASSAVQRNRLRRQIKESARLNKAPLLAKLASQGKRASLVIGMRSDNSPPTFSQIEKDVQALFDDIIHRWLT